jgi:hypothetical protein
MDFLYRSWLHGKDQAKGFSTKNGEPIHTPQPHSCSPDSIVLKPLPFLLIPMHLNPLPLLLKEKGSQYHMKPLWGGYIKHCFMKKRISGL